MPKINMRSTADSVKGQGVGSCYEEQVGLVKSGLEPFFEVYENGKGKYDIIHYHTVNLRYFLERICLFKGRAYVGYVHFLPDTLDESIKLPWLYKTVFYKYIISFYNSMDYLVTVNPCFVNRIREYGITNPKVICIPNYVSSSKFFPMEKDETLEVRIKYGIPLNSFVVLGVGQLQKRKGIMEFVETAKLLPDVTFVWAGGFSFGKISSGYEEIKEIVENPPQNVIFTGIVERDEMPLLYNMADIMFLPSYEELFPMAVLEALGCRKPVLLRDIKLYEDILFDYYMKGKNPAEFAGQIHKARESQDLYNEYCKKSWECHNLYSERGTLEKWDAFYRDVYAGAKRRFSLFPEGKI